MNAKALPWYDHFVYIAQKEDTTTYKIGFTSSDLFVREKQLQKKHGCQISMLYCREFKLREEASAYEYTLHELLTPYRISGSEREWYEFSPEVLKAVITAHEFKNVVLKLFPYDPAP